MGNNIIKGQWAVLGENLGHPIVTNGIFSVRGGDIYATLFVK